MFCLQQGNSGYDSGCDSACDGLFNGRVHGVARYVSCELLKMDYCLQIEVLVHEPQEIVERRRFCCFGPLHRVIIIFTGRVSKLVDYGL